MNLAPCRDCGYSVPADARGCPRCALNLEAERMIDRLIWLRIVPSLIIVCALAAGLLYYFLR